MEAYLRQNRELGSDEFRPGPCVRRALRKALEARRAAEDTVGASGRQRDTARRRRSHGLLERYITQRPRWEQGSLTVGALPACQRDKEPPHEQISSPAQQQRHCSGESRIRFPTCCNPGK